MKPVGRVLSPGEESSKVTGFRSLLRPFMSSRCVPPFLACLRLGLGLLLCCAALSSGFAAEKVVLQLKWRHQFQFAGYYAAIAQGYYRAAGLEVELREAQPGHDPLREVVEGHAQFGVGTANVILARAAGDPIVVLAVIYQHSPFVLMTSADSGVMDIHEMAKRPIQMEPDAAELLAYFESEGVDPKTLQLVPHTFEVADLVAGRVGSMSAYATDEPFYMKQADRDYLVFTPRAGGIDFYGDNLYTTEEELRQHPERVRKFVEASLRGWEYAMAHPGEIIDLILKDYNRGKTREQLEFEAAETAKLVHPELIELGYINPGRWRDIAHTYEKLGMLPADFSLNGFLYARNPGVNAQLLYRVGAVAAAISVLSIVAAAIMWHYHRKLRREVKARQDAEAREREEIRAKAHFYALLAHEVRTPLAGISSALSLHGVLPSASEKQEMVEISKNSADQLLHLVDEILDHSKLEAGRMVAEMQEVNVADFLSEVIELFQPSAIQKGLALEQELPAGNALTVRTDPMRLRQIVSNLLSNAIKFTKTGVVRVTAEAPAGGGLIISVSDTGPGIAPAQIDQIFEPYAQADSARSHGGTGLGLSISQQLASLLGGSISVDSQVGKGSVFRVRITG